jgi:hypothetical protein
VERFQVTESTDYEKIFRHRGTSYHKAMVDFPGVRAKEFQNLFLNHPLSPYERIIDCPALGGYLEKNLTVPVRVYSLDFCPQSNEVLSIEHLDAIQKVDRVVCLASSHHINSLGGFLEKLKQPLKLGGFIHLADVGGNSSIRYFLDDFVGEWTSTGHSGIWRNLTEEHLCSLVDGLRLVSVEERDCPWEFQNIEQMLDFCRLLFGLDLNPSNQQIMDALEKYVGLSFHNETCTVHWKLTYIDFCKYD